MENTITILQVAIALVIFNVWILRFGKATNWRGGNAQNMRQEFEYYGLSSSFMNLVGFLKLTLAALLLVGIWVPSLTLPAAMGMAALMLGAVAMHFKVNDPLLKSLPAFSMLLLSLTVCLSA